MVNRIFRSGAAVLSLAAVGVVFATQAVSSVSAVTTDPNHIESQQNVRPDICSGSAVGVFCNAPFYKHINFNQPFAVIPQVIVTADHASDEGASCVGSSMDAVTCYPKNITTAGFDLYCSGSPQGDYCGAYSGWWVKATGSWMAMETTSGQGAAQGGHDVLPATCDGQFVGGLCKGSYYQDITFNQAFATVPSVLTAPEHVSAQGGCVGGATDHVRCYPGNITKTGFRMYCSGSPVAGSCGDANGWSSYAKGGWIAKESTQTMKVQSAHLLSTTKCSGALSNTGTCKGNYYVDVTFPEAYASAPQVIVTPELVSANLACAGQATDAVKCEATNITATGFRAVCWGSPTAAECGAANEGDTTPAKFGYMAIGAPGSTQCTDATNGTVTMNITFSTLQGSPQPRFTNGNLILNADTRVIRNSNGTSVIDPAFGNGQNFYCRNDIGKIECYGNHVNATQRVHGTITLQGAVFTGSNTVADSKQSNSYGAIGMDMAPNGGNNDGTNDTLTINGSTATFQMYYNEPGDSFVLYYGNDNNCPDDTPRCRDGIDNDNDGATDYPADFSCSGPDDDDETFPESQCQDGIDNDSDGLIDYPQDPGCTSYQDDSEQNGAQCSDGVDNADPEDTLADYNDPGCYTNGIYNPNDTDETDVGSCSASFSVNLTNTLNNTHSITLTTGQVVNENIAISLTDANGNAITDPPFSPQSTVAIQARRSAGKIEFMGVSPDLVRSGRGTVNAQGVTFTGVQDVVAGFPNHYLEVVPHEVNGYDGSRDELSLTGPTSVSFYMLYTGGDSFTIFYTNNSSNNCQPSLPQCRDGIDNDNDGATDYPADFSCSGPDDNDETNPKSQCQDGIDNDGDGLIDFPQDPGCTSKQDNSEVNGPQCSDGVDNSDPEDNLADYNDPGCYTNGIYNPNDTDETDAQSVPQCRDGIDNDGDGAVDYPADFSCSGPDDNDETFPKSQCQDGIDNDNDGLVDYPQDPGCSSKQDNDESNTAQTGCIDIVKETFDPWGNPLAITAQFTFTLDGVRTTVNASNGRAKFTGVPAGVHTITETIPSGWRQLLVTPVNGTVNVPGGASCAGVVFKNQQYFGNAGTSSSRASSAASTCNSWWGCGNGGWYGAGNQTSSAASSQTSSQNNVGGWW